MEDPIFQVLNTVAPRLSEEDATQVVKEHWGLTAKSVKDVGSERDKNYRITLANNGTDFFQTSVFDKFRSIPVENHKLIRRPLRD